MNQLFAIGLGGPEIWIIVGLVVLLFGGKKIPELFRGVGKGVGELQKGLEEGKRSMKETIEEGKRSAEKADSKKDDSE
ncbi:MAG: twin-arginine translocase TatA/TatE family subunit [Fimbriimonadaceae bacterium]|nr:twin-arginine translocase TatA/TatE family subunit [Fimbriimonadaceae bacterium]